MCNQCLPKTALRHQLDASQAELARLLSQRVELRDYAENTGIYMPEYFVITRAIDAESNQVKYLLARLSQETKMQKVGDK